MDFIAVLITAPSEEDATKIASALVNERLAACANIINNVRSIYRWEGEVQDDPDATELTTVAGRVRFEVASLGKASVSSRLSESQHARPYRARRIQLAP